MNRQRDKDIKESLAIIEQTQNILSNQNSKENPTLSLQAELTKISVAPNSRYKSPYDDILRSLESSKQSNNLSKSNQNTTPL